MDLFLSLAVPIHFAEISGKRRQQHLTPTSPSTGRLLRSPKRQLYRNFASPSTATTCAGVVAPPCRCTRRLAKTVRQEAGVVSSCRCGAPSLLAGCTLPPRSIRANFKNERQQWKPILVVLLRIFLCSRALLVHLLTSLPAGCGRAADESRSRSMLFWLLAVAAPSPSTVVRSVHLFSYCPVQCTLSEPQSPPSQAKGDKQAASQPTKLSSNDSQPPPPTSSRRGMAR